MNSWQRAKITQLKSQNQSNSESSSKTNDLQKTFLETNQKLLKEYNHCCLCGEELLFTHITNFIKFEVLEEAYCSNCNIKNKKDFHKLQ